MRGFRSRPPDDASEPEPRPDPAAESGVLPASETARRDFHSHSTPGVTPRIRTVLVDLATETERGFWDEPLWLPVGGLLEGGDDLWEIVSVRLFLPVATAHGLGRPLLYLYAQKLEA